MLLVDRLNEDMKQAMRDRDKERLSVIRMLKASLQNEAIKLGVSSLKEEDEISVLSRELKQRNDSLQEFQKANRDDFIVSLKQEIEVVKGYLPEQLAEAEIESIIQDIIKKLNATSKKDFGKVMGTVMQKVKGQADGNIVKQTVQKLLQ